MLVIYAGSVGHIQVDWTWQPQSQARIPPAIHTPFDWVGLPLEAPQVRPTGQSLADALTERTVFFWMMVQVTANAPLNENRRVERLPVQAAEQMTLVRGLADDMEALTPQIVGLGGIVPAKVIPAARRFFDLIDVIVQVTG